MDLDELSKKLEKRESFPTLPGVISEVIHEIDLETSSMEDIAKIIQKDVSFSAHLVRQVNSGAYAEAGRISSVIQAVRVMGFRMLKGLCLTLPIFSRYKDVPGVSEFWYHSCVTSICCRIVARNIHSVAIDEAETAGLLHDLGKVFLILEMPQFMHDQLQLADSAVHGPDWLSEREKIGINHCFIGSKYGRMFNFPGSILEPILWHHEPGKASHNKELTHVCCLGDQIASIVGAPHPDFSFVEPALLYSLDYLGIRMEQFRAILAECLGQTSKISFLDNEEPL